MKMKIAFAGGGTGGHIYPGLAVADEIKELARLNDVEIEIFWFGNSAGMDRQIVERSRSVDHFVAVPSGKFRRYFSFRNFIDVIKIFCGFCVSFVKLLKIRPLIMFSKGGFVSVPPCAAASLLKIPVFTHECDFTPGLATKINSRFASEILLSYEETKKYFSDEKKKKTVVTGNPVRPEFYDADAEKGRKFIYGEDFVGHDGDKPVLLVLGGSLGAHQINELVVQNLDWLLERFTVVHQCGKKDENYVPEKRSGYYPFAFIYEQMKDVIAASDIVLSRSGANSIWECAVLSKPLVLIPLCGSGTRGDQVDNAEFFEKKGAAVVLKGEDADSENLKNALETLLDDSVREKMAKNAGTLTGKERPSYLIAKLVFDKITGK